MAFWKWAGKGKKGWIIIIIITIIKKRNIDRTGRRVSTCLPRQSATDVLDSPPSNREDWSSASGSCNCYLGQAGG